ncbi:mitochondrial inner membrane i-AAA protease supercomplex subunit Mgr3p [[Candida] anglica]|uniref:Mitochondrial inner membrane i-AAA protease supercomplex subunit Mgr3p n=1 Tax=[Candida] anglica TaxID=148631 RepID=A0ABP0EP17_9ASCO
MIRTSRLAQFKPRAKISGGVPRCRYSTGQQQYSYNQYNQYQLPPKTSWPKRIMYTFVGLSALSAYGYYMWWPKHTFPSSVAKILRKGLWAESENGEVDFQLALKHYLEALKHCDEIKMDTLSDEYTGIQLKIAEMFERLNMLEDAAFVYNEIATMYLKVLTSAPNSADHKRIKNEEHRAHLIQKDLRIAIKLASLNSGNHQLCKAILITHLLIAQDEVQKRLGPNNDLRKLVQSAINNKSGPDNMEEGVQFKTIVDKDFIEIVNDGVVMKVERNPMAWEPFTEEFFSAMDLLMAVCLTMGDVAMASKVRISMTEWMLLADVEPSRVLISQCNLAALLYIQAEEYESKAYTINKVVEKSTAEEEEYNLAVKNKENCIQLSMKSYESVLECAKGLPANVISANNDINEAVALATYGMGVLNLHISDYQKAERLLREARVRSKACGYEDLLGMIETELGKLFREKKLIDEGKSANRKKNDHMEVEIQLSSERKSK